jgi:hypothetical protein
MAIRSFEATAWPYFQLFEVKRPVCELVFHHPEPLSTFACFDAGHSR